MKSLLLILLISVFLIDVQAETFDQSLESRIEALEEKYFKLIQSPKGVQTFEADVLRIGGYFNSTATHIFSEVRSARTIVDEVELGLLLSGDLHQKISFFASIEFEQEKQWVEQHLPTRRFDGQEVQVEPEIMYFTYKTSDVFSIQIGALITPFGVSNKEQFDFLRWQNENH